MCKRFRNFVFDKLSLHRKIEVSEIITVGALLKEMPLSETAKESVRSARKRIEQVDTFYLFKVYWFDHLHRFWITSTIAFL
jgi:hypothetical protein